MAARQQQKLVCPHQDCGATYKWRQSLKHHVKAQHASEVQQPDQLHACSVDGCQARFTKRTNLTKHIDIKHNQQRYACPHQDCSWSFKLRQSLEKHVKAKHGLDDLQDQAQAPTISSTTFSQDETVDAKTQEAQNDSDQPQLQTCLEEEWEKQLIKEETPRGPFQCSVPGCGYVSTIGKNIVQHWNNKHTDDPSKATFTDQATGETLDLYATCKFIMQCKVCMKVRTAQNKYGPPLISIHQEPHF